MLYNPQFKKAWMITSGDTIVDVYYLRPIKDTLHAVLEINSKGEDIHYVSPINFSFYRVELEERLVNKTRRQAQRLFPKLGPQRP